MVSWRPTECMCKVCMEWRSNPAAGAISIQPLASTFSFLAWKLSSQVTSMNVRVICCVKGSSRRTQAWRGCLGGQEPGLLWGSDLGAISCKVCTVEWWCICVDGIGKDLGILFVFVIVVERENVCVYMHMHACMYWDQTQSLSHSSKCSNTELCIILR